MFRLGPVLLGKKAFQRSDRDGPVNLAAAAGRLARMRADASADAGQRIWARARCDRLLRNALGNQADIAPGIGVRRAGHHAGKVGVQPIPIDLLVLESLQHCGTFSPIWIRAKSTSLWTYSLTMKSTGSKRRSLRRSPLLSLRYSLLAQGEIRFAPARHSHGLGLILGALVPCGDGVAAIGNVVDLVASRLVGDGEIRGW